MGYGQNLKPLVVGFPLELKKKIETIAKEQNISEAESIRRICAYFFKNPPLLDLALKKSKKETVLEETHNNCNPTRFIKFKTTK